MEKSWRICVPKASPKPLSILVSNQKQPLHARNANHYIQILEIRYIEIESSKSPKKVNFIFFKTQFLLMDNIMKKRGMELK